MIGKDPRPFDRWQAIIQRGAVILAFAFVLAIMIGL
jgi:hypothetical protein